MTANKNSKINQDNSINTDNFFKSVVSKVQKYNTKQNIIIFLLSAILIFFIGNQNQNSKIIQNQNDQIQNITNQINTLNQVKNTQLQNTDSILENSNSENSNDNDFESSNNAVNNTIDNTADDTQKNLTKSTTTSNSVQAQNTQNKYLVTKVIDGDTFEIQGGQRVRMIGIDTPETVNPNSPVECYGKEASNKTKELLQNKYVTLQKDVSETDRYGRLLRYVYLDSIFINDFLVQNGFATVSTYPPDVQNVATFTESEKYAKDNSLGLWGVDCTNYNSTTNTLNAPVTTTTSTTQTSKYTCNCSKTCGAMSGCEEAMFMLNQCGCTQRDSDSDGIPCESICR